MHKTLTLRTNGVFIFLWALIVGVCFVLERPPVWWSVLIFVLIGLCTGIFQSFAIYQSPQAFLAAQTATNVKRVILESIFGKLSIGAFWLAVPAILALPWFEADIATLQNIIGSYGSLLLSRDLASLPGVFLLARIRNAR
jgi:hypothetical protein